MSDDDKLINNSATTQVRDNDTPDDEVRAVQDNDFLQGISDDDVIANEKADGDTDLEGDAVDDAKGWGIKANDYDEPIRELHPSDLVTDKDA